MNKKSLFSTCALVFLFIQPVYAIKTSKYFDNPQLKKASCLILSQYEGTKKQGVCSGTLVSPNKILTAKHCGFNNPAKASQDIHNPENKFLPLNKMNIFCNGKKVTANKFTHHPTADVAIIQISDSLSSNLSLISHDEFKKIIDQPYKHLCSAYGFGLNNKNEMKKFNGTLINDIQFLNFEKSLLMGAVDYDFKGMATYYANSMGGEITMHRGTFPHLYNQVARAQISQDELNTWFESFKEKIHRLGLKMEKSLYSPISGPLYKKTFKSFFEPLYQKAFAPFFTQLRERKLQEGTPLFSIFINVENTTLEKSGIDSGDSGGAMACKVNDQWKVVGVNSQRMDSNLAYFPEPWEPMHSQPKSRITKNGEVTPVTYEVQQWIEGLDH